MSDLPPKAFKIIVLQQNLPKIDLNDIIIHCSTINQSRTALNMNCFSILIIVCKEDMLVQVSSLINLPIDSIYVLSNEIEVMWPIEVSKNSRQLIEVHNVNELMRHLCTKAMLCYFDQGIEYKNQENVGLANLSFLNAINALNHTKNFV